MKTQCYRISYAIHAKHNTEVMRPMGAFVQVPFVVFARRVSGCNNSILLARNSKPVAKNSVRRFTTSASSQDIRTPSVKRAKIVEGQSKSQDEKKSNQELELERGDKLVLVGLGNPGPQFDRTRHNIGFMVASEFASRNGATAFKHDRSLQAELATVRVSQKTVIVVRPSTYMNMSGAAVRAVLDYYKLPHAALLVVADDIALELGRLRLRAKGSAGGHNGLRSIEKHLAGNVYARLKIGVGEPHGGAEQWSNHVLGQFSRGDMKRVQDIIWDAMDILEEWVKDDDLGRVMNAFTRKKNMASS